MTLAVGTTLGSYDVTTLIGQGGMGEVYRATPSSTGTWPSRFCPKAGQAERLCHPVERGYGGARLTTNLLVPAKRLLMQRIVWRSR